MEDKNNLYLKDILDQINLIAEFIGTESFNAFLEDTKTIYSVVRCFEIIGEATKRFSDDFKAGHSSIEWKKIAGMRDNLIHDYAGVDSEVVWQTVQDDLPPLKTLIESLLK